MNKINTFDEYQEDDYQEDDYQEEKVIQPVKRVGITYDDIMNRLTNQLIQPITPKIHPSYTNKPGTSKYTQSQPVVANTNSKKIENNSRMPGYVKPYPVNNTLYKSQSGFNMRVTPTTITPDNPTENNGTVLGIDANQDKMTTLRRINIHNAMVAKMRSRPNTKMHFQ